MIAVDATQRTIAREVARLKAEGYSAIFLDTPPAYLNHLEAVISEATFVVIPVRAGSVWDIDGVVPVVEVCQEHDKPLVFVLNAVDPRRKLLPSSLDD